MHAFSNEDSRRDESCTATFDREHAGPKQPVKTGLQFEWIYHRRGCLCVEIEWSSAEFAQFLVFLLFDFLVIALLLLSFSCVRFGAQASAPSARERRKDETLNRRILLDEKHLKEKKRSLPRMSKTFLFKPKLIESIPTQHPLP